MGAFQPKQIFRQAQESESKGRAKEASALYCSLGIYLRRRNKPADGKVMIERAVFLSSDSPRLYIQLAICEMVLGNERAASKAIHNFYVTAVHKGKLEDYLMYLEDNLRGYPSLREQVYRSMLELDRTTAKNFLRLAQSQMEQANLGAAIQSLVDALQTKTMEDEVLALIRQTLELKRDKRLEEYVNNYVQGTLAREDLIALLGGTVVEAKQSEPSSIRKIDGEKNLTDLVEELEAQLGIDLRESHENVAPLVKEFRKRSRGVIGTDSKSRIDLATAFFEMGLLDDAQDELRAIALTDPYFPQAQCLMGEILFSEKSDLGALEIFQACLRDDRATPELVIEATYKLLLIYFRLGDLKNALNEAEKLEELSPGYRDTRRLLVQLQEALHVGEEKAG